MKNEEEASTKIGAAAATVLQADGGRQLEVDKDTLKAFEEASAHIAAQLKGLQASSSQAPYSMVWPCPSGYTVTSPYGMRVHPITGEKTLHSGVDILADEGNSVIAAADGQVAAVGYDEVNGKYILIDHGGKAATLYAQLKQYDVQVGDTVIAGQTIGQVGSTGRSTGPHLHFEIRIDGEAVSPNAYVGI